MTYAKRAAAGLLLSSFFLAAGCSKSSDGTPTGTGGAGGSDTGSAQIPPRGRAAVDAWLQAGSYKSWSCEAAPHGALPVSPHGSNRICSNDLLADHGTDEYPVNAAAVKELFNGSGKLIGHAVSLHIDAGKTGSNWYWYEKINGSVAADGVGDGTCVSCHQAAGADATHPGHDFVYVQVKRSGGAGGAAGSGGAGGNGGGTGGMGMDAASDAGISDGGTDMNAASADTGSASVGTQVPPMGSAGLLPWLQAGFYKSWRCDPAPRAKLPVGAHGHSIRICSNDLMSKHREGEYPVNAAAVKELYDSAGNPNGYAVSLHVSAGKTGTSWYWYERIGSSDVADSVGAQLCAGCHQAAGSDTSHPGHDFVYVQIK